MSNKTFAFIGTGNMSYAIIGGMLKNGFDKNTIIATNRNTQKLAHVASSLGVNTTDDNISAITQADIIVLSVKPQMMAELCNSFTHLGIDLSKKLFISVAAGITIKRLREMLGFKAKLVRCMPNTPCLLGKGVSGLFSDSISAEEKTIVTEMFEATGIALWLDKEQQINDIIAVTGSSPAYFFLFMQSIAEKAEKLGFNQEQARVLVQQTALGAAEMAFANNDISLEQLRANVTSKGGTTHAAVEHLKSKNLQMTVAEAMNACIARAEEMEQQI